MKNNLFFGRHAVFSLLAERPHEIECLYLLNDRRDPKIIEVMRAAEKFGVKIQWSSRQSLDHLTENQNHQGTAVLCRPAPILEEHDLDSLLTSLSGPASFLILDQVQDPHNLGACLRTALAAGVNAVIAPKDRSVGLTPVVSKVASGAAEKVPFIQVTNLARTLEHLKEKNIWIFGLTSDAKNSIYQADLTVSAAFVLGSEGSGLRRLTRESCDQLFKIPMAPQANSLNVSVAAGISLFEMVRQRAQLD